MEKILTKRSIEFLREYVNTSSPTGYEMDGQKVWLDYIRPFTDDFFQDGYYNTVAIINPKEECKVVLEAHADEISWIVNYISPKGYVHVIPNGGADAIVAPGKQVKIHTADGTVAGVFGWPAIHLRNDMQNLYVNDKSLFVDVGALSDKEVNELGIRIGDMVTFLDEFSILNKKFFLGRGLDNRIGGFIIAEAARIIHEKNIHLPYQLLVVNAVQEEVGLYGAKMIGEKLKPHVAIVTDVTHDTTSPYIKQTHHGHTACGGGPVIAVAPAVHKGLLNKIKAIAEEAEIPYQLVAISRATGTDEEAIALSNGGVAAALISPALRYMHTPVEIVNIGDVENCIRLMVQVLKKLEPKKINSQVEYHQ